jgi:hypothetical protein
MQDFFRAIYLRSAQETSERVSALFFRFQMDCHFLSPYNASGQVETQAPIGKFFPHFIFAESCALRFEKSFHWRMTLFICDLYG